MQITENHNPEDCDFLYFVAGPGLQPGSGGYEPPEVPLLHPAMAMSVTFIMVDV